MNASAPPPPDQPSAGGARVSGAVGLLLLIVALFHGSSLANGFVYDDAWTITGNAFIREPRNLLGLLGPGPARAGVPDAGRPAMLASVMLDRALWGERAAGYHLHNLLLHAAVVLLLYAGVRRLGGGLLLAFVASALFAVHPLNVEAVAAINYREDLLAALFTLLALAAVGRARAAAGQGTRAHALRVAAAVCVAIGALAKENVSLAPVLLAIVDLCREREAWRPLLRRRLPDYLALAGAAAAVFVWRWWVMGSPGVVSLTAEVPDERRDILVAVPQAAAAFVAGVGQLFAPLTFSAAYAPGPSGWWGTAVGVAALALMAAGVGLALSLRARAPWLALGVLSAVAAYTPNLGWVPITNVRADRYFYLPSLGLCLAVAALLVAGLERVRRVREGKVLDVPVAWVVPLALVLALGVRTVHLGRSWRSDRALWRHATQAAPLAARAWLALAEAELRAGQTVEALRAVDRGLAIADDAHGRELRGLVLLEQGDLPAARAALESVLPSVDGQHRAQVLNNLGFVELRARQPQLALDRFRAAGALAPRFAAAAINAARAATELGRPAEAEHTLRAFLARVPEETAAWAQLGQLFEAQGRHAEAVAAFERAGGDVAAPAGRRD